MRHINRIVLHCSAFDGPHDAAEIHQWHLKRGWSGIGYHAVVKRSGEIEIGRPHYWQGAHCAEANADSLGICILGDTSFTLNQIAAVYYYRYAASRIFGADEGAMNLPIEHHSEYNAGKTCPNINFGALPHVIDRIAQAVGSPDPVLEIISDHAVDGASLETVIGIINTHIAQDFCNFGDELLPTEFITAPQKG